VRLARLSQLAIGLHHTVALKEDPTSVMEDMINSTLDIAPTMLATGTVAGMLVADIWRKKGDA
jgi:hypothetical protein